MSTPFLPLQPATRTLARVFSVWIGAMAGDCRPRGPGWNFREFRSEMRLDGVGHPPPQRLKSLGVDLGPEVMGSIQAIVMLESHVCMELIGASKPQWVRSQPRIGAAQWS